MSTEIPNSQDDVVDRAEVNIVVKLRNWRSHCMEKKYQVFISSTFKDLKSARLKAREAVLALYHFPVGMEMFGALDEDQWEVIKRDIDASDYYVLIIGKMFGSEVQGEGISYTQKEFRYAVEKGIPVLAFLIKEDAKVAPSFVETEIDRQYKLKQFRNEVETGRTCSYWSTTDELYGQIVASLSRQMARKARPGWVRAEEFDIEKSHAELLLLTEKVRTLEAENENLRSLSGEKREPSFVVELLSPIEIKVSEQELIPDIDELYKAYSEQELIEKYKFPKTVAARYLKYQLDETDKEKLKESLKCRARIMAGFA